LTSSYYRLLADFKKVKGIFKRSGYTLHLPYGFMGANLRSTLVVVMPAVFHLSVCISLVERCENQTSRIED